MKELINMVVVLTLLSAFSGGLLAALRNGTMEQIEKQQLINEKAPAIDKILTGRSNNPLDDRFKLKDGEVERSFYVGAFEGKANTVVFETYGKGFEGKIGLMVGVNVESDQVVGVGVTTHSETPGIGSRAKTDPKFAAQFKGLAVTDGFKVKDDGGEIDALSGATITSKGVCIAASQASDIYKRLKPQLQEKVKSYSK